MEVWHLMLILIWLSWTGLIVPGIRENLRKGDDWIDSDAQVVWAVVTIFTIIILTAIWIKSGTGIYWLTYKLF